MILKQGDCLELMKELPEASVDLVVTDPPYEFCNGGGGGAFGTKKRTYHGELVGIDKGIGNAVLDEMMRVLKKPNLYIWCSKGQLRQYFDYFDDAGCTIDLLTWHKTNPVPTCNNKYLSDTEYCLYIRKGVPLYGTYDTKRKFWITETNVQDKELYDHPTIKPLDIIEQLVTNSSQPGDVVMDPFMGSGTTGEACVRNGRDFIGFEIDENYFNTATSRINSASKAGTQNTLDFFMGENE